VDGRKTEDIQTVENRLAPVAMPRQANDVALVTAVDAALLEPDDIDRLHTDERMIDDLLDNLANSLSA
jgi:hypothetical protein